MSITLRKVRGGVSIRLTGADAAGFFLNAFKTSDAVVGAALESFKDGQNPVPKRPTENSGVVMAGQGLRGSQAAGD